LNREKWAGEKLASGSTYIMKISACHIFTALI
jgi:hypothetical protein